MPDLVCRDGDLNGYGCIGSQFVDSLLYGLVSPKGVDPAQWFGKITRFRYELTLSDGAEVSKVSEDQIKDAIRNKQITSCTLVNITYTPDPRDSTIVYADGQVEVAANDGSPIPSGNYRFKHTLKHVWRLTETIFS